MVNFLVILGTELKWHDSYDLLLRAYNLTMFRYVSVHTKASNDKGGSVIVTTAKNVGENLKEIWARQSDTPQISIIVEGVVESFPDEFGKWSKNVFSACKRDGLVPMRTMDPAFEKAVAIYLEEMEDWFERTTGNQLTASDLAEIHRAVARNLSKI